MGGDAVPYIAKLAVAAAPYAIDRPYDYLVPEQLEGTLRPGMRAAVPFGKGKPGERRHRPVHRPGGSRRSRG